MVGRKDSFGNDEPSPGYKRMFMRRFGLQVPENEEEQRVNNIPSPGAPPRSFHSIEARACLPPLCISTGGLDVWPAAGPTDGGDKMAYFDKQCSKVADHLYVGGVTVAKDKKILKDNEITHILNCVGFSCPEYFKSDFCYRSLWLHDSESEDITSILYDVFDYFEDVRERSGRIFVHCALGISRSTSLVIAYLMWSKGLSYDDAFQCVKSARGIADPNLGFAYQLLQREKRVLSPTACLLRMYKMSLHSTYDPLHLVPKLLTDPSPSCLDSRGAFIVQTPTTVYLWVGRRCRSIMEMDAKAAVCQIARYEKVEAPVMVVREGEEPSCYWDTFVGDSVVKTQPGGERKVDAYDVEIEVFQRAVDGGFVPALASSDNEHDETHLPARINSWSSLKCKFSARLDTIS